MLRRERDEARADAAEKAELLAHVSHEIRTPMNGILGMIELTLRTPLADGQREALEIARSSAESLLTLLDETLDLSRLDAGKLRPEPVEFDPGRLVEQETRLLAPGAHGKGLLLVCRIDPSTPALVVGDSQRFRQILLNLLGNAIKFTPTGRVAVELTGETADDPATARLRLTVSDTGIGIPAAKHKAVFGPFEQAEPSTLRRFGGTGLGLAISDSLARLLGGEIRLESRPGAGSTFTVVLPVGIVRPQTTAPPERPLKGLRVGLAVSEPLHRAALAQLIESAGGTPATPGEGRRDSAGPGLLCVVAEDGVAAHSALEGRRAVPVVLLEPFGAGKIARESIALPRHEPGNPARLVLPPASPRLGDLVEGDPAEIAGILSLDGSGFEQSTEAAGRIGTPLIRAEALAVLARVAGGAASPGTEESVPGGDRTDRLRVLLAEDNPVNRIVGRRMLENLGHEVQLAEDGLRALELADSDAFDLAILDIQMPALDGLSALRLIRADEARSGRRRLPIAALTAHARHEDRARHLRDGFDAFLTKPLRLADLRESLARLAPPPSPEAPPRAHEPAPGAIGRELLQLCGGDRAFLRDLVAVFLDAAPRAIGRLGEALARVDLRAIGSEAHGLRGMCLTIGATPLAEIARELEASSSTGKPAVLAGLLAEAGANWLTLRAELLDLLEDAGPP